MIVTFLSDYGLTDVFVGVCHGVIAGICPDARVIDISHGVPRGDVRAGALMLRGALGYVPVGVHLAVVDPGVGGERRAVAVRTADGRCFVGPDNGLLSLGFEPGGGVVEAVDLGRSRFGARPVRASTRGRSPTFPPASWSSMPTPTARWPWRSTRAARSSDSGCRSATSSGSRRCERARAPPRPLPADWVDQRPRPGARRCGRAPWDGGHGSRAIGGPGSTGPDMDGGGRPSAALLGRGSRSAAVVAAGRRGGGGRGGRDRGAAQVAQRRAAGRAEGRRDSGRGTAPGGLGGGRDRAERGAAGRGLPG